MFVALPGVAIDFGALGRLTPGRSRKKLFEVRRLDAMLHRGDRR